MATAPQVSRGDSIPCECSQSLGNVAARYKTPVFACKADFDHCKSSVWCQVSLIVCLIHRLTPRIKINL